MHKARKEITAYKKKIPENKMEILSKKAREQINKHTLNKIIEANTALRLVPYIHTISHGTFFNRLNHNNFIATFVILKMIDLIFF